MAASAEGGVMGRRQVSTDIGAPADRVFDLYTDAQRVGEWQTGVKSVESTGPLSEVGSKWTVRYAGPFAVKGTVLAVERPARHQQRFSEMLGLVDCTTTAAFQPTVDGTRATIEMAYVVAGGPIGRLFDDRLGSEIVDRLTRDLAGLKAVAEQ
jgi:uncharacterized membrane protein